MTRRAGVHVVQREPVPAVSGVAQITADVRVYYPRGAEMVAVMRTLTTAYTEAISELQAILNHRG